MAMLKLEFMKNITKHDFITTVIMNIQMQPLIDTHISDINFQPLPMIRYSEI